MGSDGTDPRPPRGQRGGAEPADLYLAVLAPAMRAIGDGWAAGELSIADEHRASMILTRVLGRLGPRFARPGRTRGTVVLGGAPEERHALPGSLLSDVLRGAGYAVVELGPNTPPAAFIEAAQQTARPRAILIGAAAPGNDRNVRAVIRAVHESTLDVPVLVGGVAVADAEHARRLGADGWTGPDARTALDALSPTSAPVRRRGRSRPTTP